MNERPRVTIGDLDRLDDEERRRILVDFNRTERPFRDDVPIHRLFEERARAKPDTIAVVFEDERLTYGELFARAEALADHLASLGVGPGDYVPILASPSIARIVGVLAVLAAGAAYVPIDLAYPPARREMILDDARARVVLVRGGDRPALPPSHDGVTVEIEAATKAPARKRRDGALAYVIHTSGSTGRPKGVEIEHRGLVNRLAWMERELGVTADDCILHKTAFGFDVSVWELLLPLVCGACLVVAPPAASRDVDVLVATIARHRVTICHFVPSLLEAFLESADVDRLRSLRAVVASGEALPAAVARRFQERLAADLYNLYGPTEATIDVTSWKCPRGSSLATVPIGRPIDNTTIYVLDEEGEPLPVGAEGELYIGGVGVARGYLGQPELTRERFVPDPFASVAGARLYRTGDRARFRADGAIEFIGRRDHQVKLRGFRIELGEIEAALGRHPDVRQVVALLREDVPGRRQLVAYAVGREGLVEEALRRFAAGELPDYMVPSRIVSLDALPTLANGKIDRASLPAADLGGDRVAPSTDAERAIAQLWSDLLGTSELGVHDDFFRVGGDSISSIRLVARARERGIVFDVKQVLSTPTIAGLAAAAVFRDDASSPQLTAFERAHLASPSRLRLVRRVPRETIASAPSLRARHPALRVRLADDGERWQEVANDVSWPHVRGSVATETGRLAASIDLRRGRGLAGAVVEDGADTWLVLVAHPALVDARSLVRLADEVEGAPEREDLYRRWCAVERPGMRDRSVVGGAISAPADMSLLRVETIPCGAPDPATLARHRLDLAELALAAIHLAARDTQTTSLTIAVRRDLRSERSEGIALEAAVGNVSADIAVESRPAEDARAAIDASKESLRAASRALIVASAPQVVVVVEIEGVDIVGPPTAALEVRVTPEGLVFRFRSDAGDSISALASRLRARFEELARSLRDMPSRRHRSDFALAGLEGPRLDALLRERGAVEDLYPLSPMQSGLLFHSLYWPGSDSYFNQNVLELEGPLDVDALTRAWRFVADRYAILRSGYLWEGLDEPLQYVAADVTPPWERHDWRGVAEADLPSKLDELLAEDRARGLSPSDVPLYRLTLAVAPEQRFYLLWSHHHVLLDGWCLSLIWGDVFHAYAAIVAGAPPSLPAVRPYRDYIAWLATRADDADAERFWKTYLDGFDEPTRLSAHAQRTDGAFVTREARLTQALTAALTRAAQHHGVTSSTVVQVAFSLLLSTYADSDDVVFGVSISGRPPELTGVENMVGLFINTIPVRVRIAPDAPVSSLVTQLRSWLGIANQFGHVPLAKIKSLCHASRGGGPLFDSLIAFENYPEDNLPPTHVAGVRVTDLKALEKTEYPFGIIALPGEELVLHLNYDTLHFDECAIAAIEARLIEILRRLAAEPDATIAALLAIDGLETERLVAIGDGGVASSSTPAVCQFEAMARKTPGAIAVIAGEEQVTYAELDRRADHLARCLRASGVASQDPVAVRLARGLDLVTALLAVHKAGAVWVPLDPSQPTARLSKIIDIAKPRLTLPRDTLLEGGAAGLPGPRSSDRAYVMFTSGSSGVPKGVVNRHAGLGQRLAWSVRRHGLGASARLLATASVGFDISLWEMYFPLVSGGTLILPEPGREKDIDALVSTIRRCEVSIVHFVPSLLEAFVEHPNAASCHSIRQIICGGEALSPLLLRRLRGLGLPAAIDHAYGPTEASISVAHFDCADFQGGERVPIGRPLEGTRFYVVDRHRRLTPHGISGELYIGGLSLAEGYVGAPDLTRERFVDDPFRPGERVYATGDRVRLRSDDNLEFIGRRDQQVKIHGNRIELGEIEVVLSQHPCVRRAVVLAATGPRLVGWVASDGGVTVEDLRGWLAERLPSPMIPSSLSILAELPTNAHGKIDTGALLGSATRHDRAAAPPRNALESTLVRIWEDLLDVKPIGIFDDFFDLGGHSLLVIKLVSRVRRALGDERCDITQIFKCRTIASLADRLTEGRARSSWTAIREEGEGSPLVLVHPGEGIASGYLALRPHLGSFPPVLAIQNPRFGAPARAYASLEEMAGEYAALAFGKRPAVIGGWSFGGVVALEMASMLAASGQPPDAVVLIDSYNLAALPGGHDPSRANADLVERGVDVDSAEGSAIAFEIANNGGLAARHRGTRYEGRVVLLKAVVPDPGGIDPGEWPKNGWDELLPRLEIHPVRASHRRLFDDASAGEIARLLRLVLGR